MLEAQSAILSELFPTHYRFTAIAPSREINAMALGGTTPFSATTLVGVAEGSPWVVVAFVVTCLALTMEPSPHQKPSTAPS
ncbi:hypothetical protein M8J71_10595 [Pseudarthrobacter sp. R1]|uniref:hypothetical protein n=1 Tax=Pseudarthrobacter sp. R1 TaxID=2944934 RepID=UPI002109162A|nr:hypothetical protein [Pseudarthrobacter sp. R1]MCQ6270930.1 hypothetical protein [Pseudarthrobacter sp. R1]